MKPATTPTPDKETAIKSIKSIMSDMVTIDLLTPSQKNELFNQLMGLWQSGWQAGHDHNWSTMMTKIPKRGRIDHVC